MEFFSAVDTHAHNAHAHTSHHTQNPLLYLSYAFRCIHTSVVVFTIGSIAARSQNVLRGAFSINSSACTCPQTLTLQARSILSFAFQVCSSFSVTDLRSVFNDSINLVHLVLFSQEPTFDFLRMDPICTFCYFPGDLGEGQSLPPFCLEVSLEYLIK